MITKRILARGFIVRFDGEWAILVQSDSSHIRLSRFSLPAEAREGFYIEETERPGRYRINYDITEKRQQELRWMTEIGCN